MGCAASQPVVDDLTRSDAKPGAVSTPPESSAGKQQAVAHVFSGDRADRYGGGSSGGPASKDSLRNDSAADVLGKQPSGEVHAAECSGRTHAAHDAPTRLPPPSVPQQQPQQLPPALQQISPFEALRRQQQQKLQQQQPPKQDPQPVRPAQRQVHDSADSAEARDVKKSFNAASAVDRLRGSQDDPSSPFSTVSQAAAAAADVMRGRHSSFQGSVSSDTAGSSQEDTFPELGACSGQAMNRLSQVYSRRLSRTDERGSADLDRRQSLNYMKQVDSIVQSFDIQEDEIEIERDADGNDLVLGHGAYGQVYKGLRGGVQDVAVKVLFDADEAALSRFIKEISLLKSLNYDRNIVQFYGARLRVGQTPMMVLEFMEGGNLRSAIDKDYTGQLKWNMRGFSLALDIAKGIHFLHAHNVIHSDLKTSNILLDRSQTTAKISDVGLARVMERKQYRSSDEHAWTFVYAAPEMLMGRPCNTASDIYSLGVCLWELVCREAPVRGRTHRPKTPQDCPEAIADLISQCMSKNPDHRPSAREVHDTIKKAHSSGVKASTWFA